MKLFDRNDLGCINETRNGEQIPCSKLRRKLSHHKFEGFVVFEWAKNPCRPIAARIDRQPSLTVFSKLRSSITRELRITWIFCKGTFFLNFKNESIHVHANSSDRLFTLRSLIAVSNEKKKVLMKGRCRGSMETTKLLVIGVALVAPDAT